ncbi:DUF6497 family protein [uncultured Paracoccus sp.]|uniref:DUF6497 family protein n=1 Tax=uncultured Paracoccus sp. TaxID=189685 RepID=UPI002610A131|nr:DUF6497 family protein [uncultured Paracoccus sp.]
MPAPATVFLMSLAAADSAHVLFPVPSGAEVWLQEVLTDRVVGMGLVGRFRFVMPALADQVPPIELDMHELPGETLTDEDIAALNDGSLSGEPLDEPGANDPEPIFEVLPPDTPAIDVGPDPTEMPDAQMIPEERFDLPAEPVPPGTEAAADADIVVPAAPDILMQDPNHADVVWLCENVALPRIRDMAERPQQVVISIASEESEFGTFDPEVVQLFEGFRIPPDRDVCEWEPW